MADPALTILAKDRETAGAYLADAVKTLTDHAIEAYLVRKEKKSDGYQIKITHQITIFEPALALQYCLQHLSGVLEIDTKKFKAAFDANVIPEGDAKQFVKSEDVAKVYIDSDLSKFMPLEGEK